MTFVPSGADYELAIAFYRDLGFETQWRSEDLAVMRNGGCRFYLQRILNEELQRNFMMFLEVDDLDAWWQRIEIAALVARYPGVAARPPELYPWGKREIHLIDPAGVLWHIAASTTASA